MASNQFLIENKIALKSNFAYCMTMALLENFLVQYPQSIPCWKQYRAIYNQRTHFMEARWPQIKFDRKLSSFKTKFCILYAQGPFRTLFSTVATAYS